MVPTIPANPRPNAPQWPRTTGAGVGLVWHHVIPFNTLRDVWNGLIEYFRGNNFQESRVAVRQYLLLCDRGIGNIEQMLDGTRRGDLSVPDGERLKTAAAWPAWNIVEGPDARFRGDNPRDGELDRFTHGLTALELARVRAVESLYPRLLAFANAANHLSPADARALGDWAVITRQSVQWEQPIGFRNDMWEQAGGLWRKRRS